MRACHNGAVTPHWPTPAVPAPGPPAAEIAEPAPVQAPAHDIAPEPPRPWWRRGLSWLVVAGAFLLKFGKAALLLIPKAKLLTTSGTMLVSLVAYSFIWGWKFALGFVVLLLVHEMGHVIQLRREGVEASAPVFIPFLGAFILLKDFWYALVFTGLFLNLFNLLPVVPLDGGRAMAALSPWMWFLGLFAMALLAFVYPNPIMFLILLFAAMETYRRWKARKAGGEEVATYYRVKPAHRLAILAVYLGLIVVCGVGMELTHIERSIPS